MIEISLYLYFLMKYYNYIFIESESYGIIIPEAFTFLVEKVMKGKLN